MKKLFSNKWLLLALIIAIIAGRKLLTLKHFHIHDDIQIFRVNEYLQCWKDGQIPCRWSKNLGKGYGYPLFIFYPPMIYAIPALISKIGFSITASLNIFSFLTFPLAAYAMYKLAYVITKNKKLAFLASIMYTLYPYHAVNVFVRGAYAEALSWSIFPLVLEGFYRLVTEKITSYKPAIALTIILLTHNISSVIIYPLALLWTAALVFHHYKKGKKINNLKTILINFLLPIALSAFFLLPALLENKLVQTGSMRTDYYSYTIHFVAFAQLFLSNFWGYGGSSYVPDDGMSFMVGKPYWILYILVAFYYVFKNRKNLKELFHPIFIITAIGAPFALFLTHYRSTPIWEALPVLQYFQFPWRLIGIAGLLMITMIVFGIKKLSDKSLSFLTVLISLILIYQFLPFFKPQGYDEYSDQDYISGQFANEQTDSHLFDYMPLTVHEVPVEIASAPIYESTNTTETENVSWQSNLLELDITQESSGSAIFSIYDYPGWSMTLDGAKIDHSVNYPTGLIEAGLPEGTHQVRLNFQETNERKFANIISLISLAYLIHLIRNSNNK